MTLFMLFLAVLALAVCQCVVADSCQNTTISSPSDTSLFVSCDKIKGTLTVSESFSGVLNLTEISQIQGDLTVTNVGGITKINLPALEKVEGTVTVTDNGALKNLTLSGLQSVSGRLTVQGNSGLSYVDLQNLEDVEGGLALVGGFSVSLPNINEVNGDTTIQGADMSCGVFDRLAADGTFTGSYSCSASSSGLSPGAKAGIAIAVILIVCIIAAGIWFCLRRRRAAATVNENGDVEKTQYHILNTKSILRLPRKPFPPKQPSESVPMLDGRMILEATPGERRDRRPIYELDAGPQSSHQRPINHE